MAKAKFRLRSIAEGDIPRLVEIEKKITGAGTMSPLERSIHNYVYYGDPDLCIVAEIGKRVVGFLIGEIRPWEFGHEEVGWLKAVGIDPEYQGQGIGKALGDAVLKSLKEKGVHRVRTLVEWDSGDLITYFRSLGFVRSDLLVLERGL